jgi:CDP-diacylglycerol--serine O-phosphatidyltransferase
MTAPAAGQGENEISPAAPLSHDSRSDQRRRRREHRRRRFRRHGRRAYIRSVYFLPSMATLGNAICGFGAMYVAALAPDVHSRDRLTNFFSLHHFTVAAYLIFLAMVFDALDGRLARFARHTTDFGGQLDSLADVVSFGVAPAYIALLLFKAGTEQFPPPTMISRLIWAIGALYVSCAAIRLARFNVSNEHGEQHHFSFLGLPSPGAGGTVAAWVLMQQDLSNVRFEMGDDSLLTRFVGHLSTACLLALPLIVLLTGLLMISNIRYPHLVNRYLRGRRSIGRLMVVLVVLLLMVVAHQYVLALGMMLYVLWGVTSALARLRRRGVPPTPPPTLAA